MLGKLICRIYGHKRGKRIPMAETDAGFTGLHVFRCPRCMATWTRKVKAAGVKLEQAEKGGK